MHVSDIDLPARYLVLLKTPDADSSMTPEEVSNRHHEWLHTRLDGNENRLIGILNLGRVINYCARLSDSLAEEVRQRDDVEFVELEVRWRAPGLSPVW